MHLLCTCVPLTIAAKVTKENDLLRRYSHLLFIGLRHYYKPVAIQLSKREWITEDTLKMISSDQLSPKEKALLLIRQIEERNTASETGQDFIVLCEILYDSCDELQELSNKLKEEYGALCHC